jgi:phage terminase small subunit
MLNSKQTRFIEAYAISLNATKAAQEAGYSLKTAYSQGQRLLKHVEIKREIAARVGKAAQKAEIRLDAVMGELRKLAFSNMSDFCTWTSTALTLKPSGELSQDLLAAVESIAETEDKNGGKLLKIKLHSKIAAINGILKLFELTEIEARLAALEERVSKS